MITASSIAQNGWRVTPNENPAGQGTFTYNLRFPGQYYDAETGKHYNYFRDYDASIGRYLESDPLGLYGGANTFGYVAGNPLRYFDRKGLEYANAPGSSDIAHCLLHPADCWNASPKSCRADAVSATRDEFGHNGNNDASDAFRHCYWSCCMTQNGGAEAARGIGQAHENKRDNPKCEMNMDLFNNEMGISFALASPGSSCRLTCKRAPLQKAPKGDCGSCNLYSAP